MRQALLKAPGDVVLEERPLPGRDAGTYLVAVRACGICTWEQRVHRGVGRRYPFAGGHELGGVVAAGPGDGLAPGTVVAVSRLPRCGRCQACRSGFDNLCAYLTPGAQDPGGLAEYVVAAAADVMPLPNGFSPLEAALVEPLACVLNSLWVAKVELGTRLAVLGNGFMGVLHARAAAARGADATLFRTDPTPAGLAGAWQGEERDLELGGEAFAARAPAVEDDFFDAAIVIRGAPQSVVAAAHLVRLGGTVSVYASLSGEEDIGLPSLLMRRKQVALTAAASHRAADFADAAEQVGSGSIAVGDLVHRSYPLAEAGAALEYASETDSGRVMVTFDSSAELPG